MLVTASSEPEAKAIAQALIQNRLAACVSIFPIQSIYTWQGAIEEAQEWQLLIKTDLAKFAALEAKIQASHSYAVPEIIALPITQGAEAYLGWLAAQVSG